MGQTRCSENQKTLNLDLTYISVFPLSHMKSAVAIIVIGCAGWKGFLGAWPVWKAALEMRLGGSPRRQVGLWIERGIPWARWHLPSLPLQDLWLLVTSCRNCRWQPVSSESSQLICISDIYFSTDKYKRHSRAICSLCISRDHWAWRSSCPCSHTW